ncbi:ImmA/IrrE family metallo-endopeptidase [Lysinibacillus sphaericus]|uniref:ImmA/IrrE family metallo-endopeptidase n=1 Tax=Lysinibacillus sphaericus TaxID=1421 RepID=UPI000566913B|nr:ImmA/IrrE family metallo-endopeptidase [Lysinibacillus sphaericus]QTB24290.1 ImmA/IrrE family metallo-endopeptidase [Lysinibacillus sphaericus]
MTHGWTYTESYVKEMYVANDIFYPEHLNFQTIAYRLGINMFYWQEPSQALFFKDKGYIMLNESLSPQQKWQDFCHELAHVLLHTGHQRRMSPLFREYQENKANNFMYHACIPSFMLDEIESNDLNVQHVKQLFNVEYDFAFKRLEQYISNKQLF